MISWASPAASMVAKCGKTEQSAVRGSERRRKSAADVTLCSTFQTADAPRVSKLKISRRASIRLATPKRVCSCAVFFAKPR